MKVIETGHVYELNTVNLERETVGTQTLTFMRKLSGDDHEGTTNEEVLRMLIDRMKHLNGVLPCRENSIVITKLEEALMWINQRTFNRQEQNVIGTSTKHNS